MNAARIWKLVTAGFIVAGLLVAVPAESQALTQARQLIGQLIGRLEFDRRDRCCPGGRVRRCGARAELGLLASRHSRRSQSGTGHAAKVRLPTERGRGRVRPEGTRRQVAQREAAGRSPGYAGGGRPRSPRSSCSLSTRRLAKLKKTVPFPDYKAKSAKTYAKSPYRVYEIYGTSLGPGFYHWTWKYGITRQLSRRNGPNASCQPAPSTTGRGTSAAVTAPIRGSGSASAGSRRARSRQALLCITRITNGGNCPPGMPACV